MTVSKVFFLHFYLKKFNYDVSWHGFILFEVYLASCFYKFVSFTKFGKFSAMISSKTFSAPLSSLPRWQSLCLGLICWFGLTFVGCGSKGKLINQTLSSAILVCRVYLVPLGLSLVLAGAAFRRQEIPQVGSPGCCKWGAGRWGYDGILPSISVHSPFTSSPTSHSWQSMSKGGKFWAHGDKDSS